MTWQFGLHVGAQQSEQLGSQHTQWKPQQQFSLPAEARPLHHQFQSLTLSEHSQYEHRVYQSHGGGHQHNISNVDSQVLQAAHLQQQALFQQQHNINMHQVPPGRNFVQGRTTHSQEQMSTSAAMSYPFPVSTVHMEIFVSKKFSPISPMHAICEIFSANFFAQ